MSENDLVNDFREERARHRADIDAVAVPKGWESYTQYTDGIGEAIVTLPTPGATENDLLVRAGFNPDEWRITPGSIQVRQWHVGTNHEWNYYYKFSVIAGESEAVVEEHVEDLVAKIRSWQTKNHITKPRTELMSGDAFAFFASDWQIGKAEGSIGTSHTVDRVLEGIEKAEARIQELRRIGRGLGTGAFIGMGDIVEGCHGNYPGQSFLVDRNRRDQNKIARELISYGIDTLSPYFDEFKVACVHGNHGEHRQDGKKATDDADNDDTACFETVKEAYDRVGQEIDWRIPDDEMAIALELGGVKVGITHGHTFRKGSTAQQKALEWFRGQDFGFQEVRGAQILVSAHFHHYLATEVGSRTMFQCPAADPGSKWFRDSTGEDAPPGFLTMRFSEKETMGYSDVQVLRPSF